MQGNLRHASFRALPAVAVTLQAIANACPNCSALFDLVLKVGPLLHGGVGVFSLIDLDGLLRLHVRLRVRPAMGSGFVIFGSIGDMVCTRAGFVIFGSIGDGVRTMVCTTLGACCTGSFGDWCIATGGITG